MTSPASIKAGEQILQMVTADGYFGSSFEKHVGSKCCTTALTVALFCPVTSFVYCHRSAQMATHYDTLLIECEAKRKMAMGDERKIHKYCHLILKEMKAERMESAISQFMMGTGFAVVLLALFVAIVTDGQVPQVATMFRYGFAIAGFGMGAYTFTQLFFHIERKSRIAEYHNTLSALLRPPAQTVELAPVATAVVARLESLREETQSAPPEVAQLARPVSAPPIAEVRVGPRPSTAPKTDAEPIKPIARRPTPPQPLSNYFPHPRPHGSELQAKILSKDVHSTDDLEDFVGVTHNDAKA